jgi:hypothetical protein
MEMQVPSKGPFWPKFLQTLKKLTGGGGAKSIYHIRAQPPHVTIQEGANRYRIQIDGSTFLESHGLSVPIPGCRHWRQLITLRRLVNVSKSHTALLLFALATITLFALQLFASDAEMRASYVTVFAYWASLILNTVLVILAGLTAFALLAWNFGKGLKISLDMSPQGSAPMMLGSGSDALGISPDIAIISKDGETSAQYAQRCLDAIKNRINEQQWIIMIPIRSGLIQIRECGDTVTTVRRNDLKSGLEDWPEEITKMESFTYETKYEYDLYISRFFSLWPEYARALKVRTETPGASLTEMLETIASFGAKTSLIFAFSLFAITAFSQPKSVQVSEYLGAKNSAVVPPLGGDVVFKFQDGKEVKDIRRTADGKNNLIGLLKSPSTYTDADNMGKLIAITYKGQTIRPTPKPVETVKMEVETAKPLFEDTPGKSFHWPDSAVTNETITQLERDFENGLKEADKWSVRLMLSNLSRYAFHLLIGLIGLLYFTAACFNNEGRLRPWGSVAYGRWPMIIGNAASFCTLCLCVVTGVLFMAFVGYNLFFGSLWRVVDILFSWNSILCLTWFGMLAIAIRVVDWLTPNPIVMDQFNFGDKKGIGSGR